MKKKPSITIAIPAYNESQNIVNQLDYINNHDWTTFELKAVILISDGSNDNTGSIIKDYKFRSDLNKKVVRVISKKRLGKVSRLNQIFDIASSDFLYISDADIAMECDTVEELYKRLVDTETSMCSSHQIPVKPSNFIGKVIFAGYKMWDDVRLLINNEQNSIHNFYGASTMYSKKFYKSLVIPSQIHDERGYLYLSAYNKSGFSYALKSRIYYLPVSNLNDFIKQSSRSKGDNEKLVKIFGNDIQFLSKTPTKAKLIGITKNIVKSPVYSILFILLKFIVKKLNFTDPLVIKGTWSQTESTKKAIKIS